MKAIHEFFLFDFFQKLKKTSIELDLKQYTLLLDCLFWVNTSEKTSEQIKEQTRRLCKLFWLPKQVKYEVIFNTLFDESWQGIEEYLIKKSIKNDGDLEKINETSSDSINGDKALNTNDTTTTTKPGVSQGTTPPSNVINNELTEINKEYQSFAINLDNGSGDSIGQSDKKIELYSNQFSFSDSKHLPFTQRSVEHGWRKLKGKTNKIPTQKIDIKANIKYKSEKKYVDKIIFQMDGISSQHVIWLTDHGGSMTPFEQWDEQLFLLLKKIPNKAKIERYYFHDCPLEKEMERGKIDFILFKDKIYTEPKYFSKIQKGCNKDTIIIIFSDGGAAHKKNDPSRVKTFFSFNKLLTRKTNRIIWFNPVIDLEGTSASFMTYFIETFLPTNKEIKNAISNL